MQTAINFGNYTGTWRHHTSK